VGNQKRFDKNVERRARITAVFSKVIVRRVETIEEKSRKPIIMLRCKYERRAHEFPGSSAIIILTHNESEHGSRNVWN